MQIKNFIMVFHKRNLGLPNTLKVIDYMQQSHLIKLALLDTILYASYLNIYFVRENTKVCLGEAQIKHLTFCFRNHLYLSPTGHQVKGWINSQVAFIGSYETGKMIMVAATLKVKHVTLELGEEVLFEYADFDKRQQRDQFKYGRGIKKKGRSIHLTSSR